jgi:hypothetical protein
MMDHKKMAIDRLREYESMCAAVENLRLQIHLLRQRQASVFTVQTDRVVVSAGNNAPDQWLVESIAQLQQLELSLGRTMQWLRITDSALETLNSEELTILRLLYIKKEPRALETLCQLLEVEKSSVYRRRDKALQKFMRGLYGV